MPRIMIVVGSVRPGRIGLPIANWVMSELSQMEGLDLDFADLAEIGLPLMDEPNHPRLHDYQHHHSKAWSARVDAADAFVFVTPEYNHSFSPALKNAVDYLHSEWTRKPVTFVSYGGISSGTRGVVALKPALISVGMVPTLVNVELPFAARQLDDDGVFQPSESQQRLLAAAVAESLSLTEALSGFQVRSSVTV
jgi:NAD(P)H-dependent FMN reductase